MQQPSSIRETLFNLTCSALALALLITAGYLTPDLLARIGQ